MKKKNVATSYLLGNSSLRCHLRNHHFKRRDSFPVLVLVTNGCLDMDMKSSLSTQSVQCLSSICLRRESVLSLSTPGPDYVNSPHIFHERGQRLDFKIQSLTGYCPRIPKPEFFPDRTNSGQRLDLQILWSGFTFWAFEITKFIFMDRDWTTFVHRQTLDKVWISV